MSKLLVEHLFLALLIGCLGWFVSDDIYCIPSALISGWLVDVDHLCDYLYYLVQSKKLNLSLVRTGQYFKANNKIVIPLHSWEISTFLFLFGILMPEYRAAFVSAALAHIGHLLQDQRAYDVRLCGYSLISRMKRGFAYSGFCSDGNN